MRGSRRSATPRRRSVSRCRTSPRRRSGSLSRRRCCAGSRPAAGQRRRQLLGRPGADRAAAAAAAVHRRRALLMVCGVIQNLDPDRVITTIAGGSQTLPGGPVASQEAIKLLGTNGGGFFNANSAHPFENPTPVVEPDRDRCPADHSRLSDPDRRDHARQPEAGHGAAGGDGGLVGRSAGLDHLGGGRRPRCGARCGGCGDGGQGDPVRDLVQRLVRGRHHRHLDRRGQRHARLDDRRRRGSGAGQHAAR